MITIRRASERGHGNHGWLDSHHTFSFAGYRDPQHMGFRSLRVINEDRVAAGEGFGTHGHDNMEIVSYVLSGALEHRDSMGNGAILKPGEFQRISAGSGIEHSEYNPSRSEPVHFYQIWIRPNVRGGEPSYQQREFSNDEKTDRWRLVASPEGADGSLSIQQDARIYLARWSEATPLLEYELAADRHVWLQVLEGELTVNGAAVAAGDGIAVTDEKRLELQGTPDAEVMLFDLA